MWTVVIEDGQRSHGTNGTRMAQARRRRAGAERIASRRERVAESLRVRHVVDGRRLVVSNIYEISEQSYHLYI